LWARDTGALAGRSGIDRWTTPTGLWALACRGTVKLSGDVDASMELSVLVGRFGCQSK
jgi:hypothetical protein